MDPTASTSRPADRRQEKDRFRGSRRLIVIILAGAVSFALVNIWKSGQAIVHENEIRQLLQPYDDPWIKLETTSSDKGNRTVTADIDGRNTGIVPKSVQIGQLRHFQTQQQQQQQQLFINRTSTKPNPDIKPIRFIPLQQFSRDLDFFSATWWQSKERFLRAFRPHRIQNVEGAVFTFMNSVSLRRDVRMTLDWLKFSVEHLSKTWKITGFALRRETPAYIMFVERMLDYTSRALTKPPMMESQDKISSAMTKTIAVIAFMPYKSATLRGQVLTTASLAATIASLVKASCGRIVIAIDQQDMDAASASIMVATKQLLLERNAKSRISRQRREYESFLNASLPPTLINTVLTVNPTNRFEYKVHGTQVAVAVVNCTEADETKRRKMRMIPKAALVHLKKAFDAKDVLHTQQWLGGPTNANVTAHKNWKYTYLTEPDTILHMRPEAVPPLSREIRRGKILLPHRLQPIPHARDLPNYHPDRVVPASGNFSTVLTLGSDAMCCDDGPSAPGFVKITVCGRHWWLCGFGTDHGNDKLVPSDRHARLSNYTLMDLQDGTHIVNLAGTEHGRRCLPKFKSRLPSGEYVDDC